MGKVEIYELCRCAQNYWGDIVFYDKFVYLCKQKDVSPSKAAIDAGISKSLVTKWKTAKVEIPSPDVLSRLSKYFNIPVSELIGEDIKKQPSVSEGLSLQGVSAEDIKTIKAYLELPEDQRRALAKILGISE